jgi:hypothetical protein
MKKVVRRLSENFIVWTMKRPITIYYTPPKNIGIPLASYIYKASDARTFSALIYYWALKGYLTIETISFLWSSKFYLHRKNPVIDSEIHQQVIARIFK